MYENYFDGVNFQKRNLFLNRVVCRLRRRRRRLGWRQRTRKRLGQEVRARTALGGLQGLHSNAGRRPRERKMTGNYTPSILYNKK